MKTIKAKDRFDEPVTQEVLEQVIARGHLRRSPDVHATGVQYVSTLHSLLVSFADQSAVALPVKNYPELSALSAKQLKQMAVGFGGSALCLDERDLHVSIAGLVSASQSLMQMAVTMVAARNGSRSSAVKAQTSRDNGLKGGRPRKLAVA
jgi:hypothetical protein